MRRCFALLLFLLLLPGLCIAESPTDDLDAALDKLLKGHRATGAAICVAKDGEIVYEHYYG